MKFTSKIIMSVTAIIAVIFSIAGIVICHQNFSYALEKTIHQNIDNHLLERYGVENNIINYVTEKEEIAKEKIIIYAKNLVSYLGNSKQFAIYLEKERIYSNLQIMIEEEEFSFLSNSLEIKYVLKESENTKYMLVGSSIEVNQQKITFVSVYDITETFSQRDRQLINFYQIDSIVIVISLLSVTVLSMCLTKPIQKLNDMSKEMAKGLYQQRTNIKTNDEIGELSESFNKMADAIESKIQELELSVKQREEFITNFNHELKNPMTSIIGYADILKSQQYTEDVKIKAATYIFNEAKRLEILARKLMDLMELSSENIKFERIEMIAFANKIKEEIKEELGKIQLELEVEEGMVIADTSLLEDCIRNLIDNSKKANPKDDKIIFFGKHKQGKYEISIIDKGCGIPKEEIPKIKDSFYMVDKARAKVAGRNGIGLSICEKIAKLHHSELNIESSLQEGTKVTLYLEVEKNEE